GENQNDQHPPSDIRAGEKLIADIYNMISTSPSFDKTMFVITYDEHGGTYDHVPPPSGAKNPNENQNEAGQDGFLFNRFGVRVPCVVVNPNIKKGLIARPDGYIPFDHSSIIKTIQTCFKLEGHLTERDKAAPDFSCLLTETAPRKIDLPTLKPQNWNKKVGEKYVNDLHHVMGDILESMTGNSKPNSEELLEYIQTNYKQLFDTSK
ncbi:MAG: alkaline phosphatase family protein, partial [Polaribacter sp.]